MFQADYFNADCILLSEKQCFCVLCGCYEGSLKSAEFNTKKHDLLKISVSFAFHLIRMLVFLKLVDKTFREHT